MSKVKKRLLLIAVFVSSLSALYQLFYYYFLICTDLDIEQFFE